MLKKLLSNKPQQKKDQSAKGSVAYLMDLPDELLRSEYPYEYDNIRRIKNSRLPSMLYL